MENAEDYDLEEERRKAQGISLPLFKEIQDVAWIVCEELQAPHSTQRIGSLTKAILHLATAKTLIPQLKEQLEYMLECELKRERQRSGE